MEIHEIKQNLTLAQILHHYGLKPKNNMLNCPFHEDKTASLQVNLEKHYYKCHACGAKGDQIQWVQDCDKDKQTRSDFEMCRNGGKWKDGSWECKAYGNFQLRTSSF